MVCLLLFAEHVSIARVGKGWKNYSHGSVRTTERLLKRKHPVFPLTSSQDDKQTDRRIEWKKAGHRLVFDDSKTIDLVDCKSSVSQPTTLPKATVLSVSSALQIRNTRKAGSQTVKSSCHCNVFVRRTEKQITSS